MLNFQRKHLGLLWAFTESYLEYDRFGGSLDYIQVLTDGSLMAFDGYFAVILKAETGIKDRVFKPKGKVVPGKVPHFTEPELIKDWTGPVKKWEVPYLGSDVKNLKFIFSLDLLDLSLSKGDNAILKYKDSSLYSGKKDILKTKKGSLAGLDTLYLPNKNLNSLVSLCQGLNLGTVFKGFIFNFETKGQNSFLMKLSNADISVFTSLNFT